jgi:tRNA threonylcarbamoyladenosine biosynthesis protein TsaB
LLWQGDIIERYQIAPRKHAQLILPMVESLMAEAGTSLTQLDALAFGRGPGSFTGVRIAAGVIQGLAFGADRPVVPVSTLAALAQSACRETRQPRILAVLDARIQEVYWGAYQMGENNLVQLQGQECVCRPGQVPLPQDGDWYGAGSGWEAYAEPLREHLGPTVTGWHADMYPRAYDVALLGADGYLHGMAVAAELALPVYLRDEVTHKA